MDFMTGIHATRYVTTSRVALSAVAWTSITPPAVNPTKVLLKNSDTAIAIYLDSASDGSAGNVTLNPGESIVLKIVGSMLPATTSVLMYAQSASGTPSLECMWGY